MVKDYQAEVRVLLKRVVKCLIPEWAYTLGNDRIDGLSRQVILLDAKVTHESGKHHLLGGGHPGLWIEIKFDWGSLNRYKGHHSVPGDYVFIGIPLEMLPEEEK